MVLWFDVVALVQCHDPFQFFFKIRKIHSASPIFSAIAFRTNSLLLINESDSTLCFILFSISSEMFSTSFFVICIIFKVLSWYQYHTKYITSLLFKGFEMGSKVINSAIKLQLKSYYTTEQHTLQKMVLSS